MNRHYARQFAIGAFAALIIMALAGASGIPVINSSSRAFAQGTPTPSPTATPSPTPDVDHCQISLGAATFSLNENAGQLVITVNRSCDDLRDSKVDFFTQNGSAAAGSDFQFASGRVEFAAGETSKNITVNIIDDGFSEATENFSLVLYDPAGSSRLVNPSTAVITILDNDAGGPTPTPTPTPNPSPTPSPSPTPDVEHCQISLGAANFSVNEDTGSLVVAVNRTCDRVRDSKVDFITRSVSASDRSDFTFAAGRIFFAPGETAKTITILITNDVLVEGDETFQLLLRDPGGSATLVSPSVAVISIIDNDKTAGAPNPVMQTAFFVQQHYADFLGRQADPAGFNAWQDVINQCPAGSTDCDRIHVSSMFFRSPEFQERGYFVYRFYEVSFGRKPDYAEFMPDIASVSGFFTEAEKEAQKVAFIQSLMSRPEFVNRYNALADAAYVDQLLSTAGLANHWRRNAWVSDLQEGSKTRAQILREITESPEVYQRFYNRAFVVMQYFGYLRRDPDALYVDWVRVLDETGNPRTMIQGFVDSLEYKFRFGQ